MIDARDSDWLPPGNVADRHQTWRFIRSFVAAFSKPLADGDGVDPAVLDDAAVRLGHELPTALREGYLLFGRRRDLTRSQDTLLSPEHLRVDPSGSVLVFRIENQSCASWGVLLAELDLDDPPVVMEAGKGWVPFSERLSLAMAEIVLMESMLSDYEENTTDNRELDETALSLLEAEFGRLDLPDLPFWAGADDSVIRWFHGPDVLLRDDGGAWLWVHGRNPRAVAAVRERLPGDWQMVPDDDDE
ncbi:hypothetical protein ABIA35_002261 [Catenulispora sp. MAP12-49]|uniref:hypothetical protein n=1 Tax=unclassified Catenulispora TaxID=414885 RepID=UPI003516F1F9